MGKETLQRKEQAVGGVSGESCTRPLGQAEAGKCARRDERDRVARWAVRPGPKWSKGPRVKPAVYCCRGAAAERAVGAGLPDGLQHALLGGAQPDDAERDLGLAQLTAPQRRADDRGHLLGREPVPAEPAQARLDQRRAPAARPGESSPCNTLTISP